MSKRHARQAFLGANSEQIIRAARIGVIGLNGGGSHIVQQLGHIGFRRFVVYDPDRIDDGSNLNRNVLATLEDAAVGALKTDLAARSLRGLAGPELELTALPCRWQDDPDALRGCDLVFGCVDTFAQRHELESCTRRHLIPYLDVGLDVTTVEGEPPRMGGQVILSMPGAPCFWCLGFLSHARLGLEAARYGDTGGHAQVVWGNGVLASAAVGIAVDLLCDWTGRLRGPSYLSYDGNLQTLTAHPRLAFAPSECVHYPADAVGDPRFVSL